VEVSRSAALDSVIEFKDVTKVFRHRPALFNVFGHELRGETRALDRVSLRVQPGNILVLLGPNGSGKSTTLKLISTIFLPDEGRITVGGIHTAADPDGVKRQVGVAIAGEHSFFPRLTLRETLEYFAALENVSRSERRDRVAWALNVIDLTEYADMLVQKCSTGMYQRLGISRALLKRPSILLLDEPTRSLDPGATVNLWHWVKSAAATNTTVVLATHNLEEAAAVADEVIVLHRGTVAGRRELHGHGSASELRAFYAECVHDAAALAEAAKGRS
jgi:ABC-2 type transport system ATP-binding protein